MREKSGTVYWMRFGLAILSAVLCAFLRLKAEGVAVGVALHMVSCVLAPYVIKNNVNLERNEIFMLGLGTYSVTWITFWVLLYTLLETM